MTDVQGLIAEVERARRDYLARVTDLTSEQGDFKPSQEAWSAAEITEHLVHAEHGGINLIWSALDGIRRGRPVWSGDPPHRGLPIERVIERTWKAKETAPDGARPDWGGPLGYWTAALSACRSMLAQLGAKLEGADLERVIYPHPISGPLDARQRLEFLRFHIDRHRAQVERIREAPGFPK